MKKKIILVFLTVLLVTSVSISLNPSCSMAQFNNVQKWRGEFQYKLDRSEGFYDNRVTFVKLKGLYGNTVEKVIIKGSVVFSPSKKKHVYVGRGRAKYDVSIMTVSKLGEAAVVHLTNGKGDEKILPNRKINYLRFNTYNRTYSIRITPGISDEELDAFGVFVERASDMKITRALLNKMEEHNRNIPFPQFLKKMFPDSAKHPDRENIAAEALEIPLPVSGTSLTGSFKDEKGGILTWKFSPFRSP
jgi:hypothetical protein